MINDYSMKSYKEFKKDFGFTFFKNDMTFLTPAMKLGNKLLFSRNQHIGYIRYLDETQYRALSFDWSDIDNIELVATPVVKKKHTLGRAVVGGVVAGGIGAVVGGMTGNNASDYNQNIEFNVTFTDGTLAIVKARLMGNNPTKRVNEYNQLAVKVRSYNVMFNSQREADEVR